MLNKIKDYNRWNVIFAVALMLPIYVFFGKLSYLMYMDFHPPLYNVEAENETAGVPGGTAVIKVKYSRDYYPKTVMVVKRWLECDDGTSHDTDSIRPITGSTSWLVGKNMTERIHIKIPESIKPGQYCRYNAIVYYGRYVLHDILMRNPPYTVSIPIVESR
jgi:hypothetical protein